MFKKIAFCVASASMMMASAGAMAHSGHHIVSPTSTFTLVGPASLGTLNCTLSLTGTLNENWVAHPGGHGAGKYNEFYGLTGTNIAPSDPGCAFVSVTGGNGRVTGSSSMVLDNLTLNVFGTPCNATNVAASVTSASPLAVGVAASTVCGDITADLEDETGTVSFE